MRVFEGLTILHAEDEGDLAARLKLMLEMDGAAVISAPDGEQALRLFQERAPDVVVSDIRMPRLDGIALATEIRAVSPDTPVILCTAFSETEYLLKSIEAGISAFVLKPIDYKILSEALRKAAAPLLQRREIERLRRDASAYAAQAVGSGLAIRAAAEQAILAAPSSYSILLEGETGCGKTHVARLVHGLSRRVSEPFVACHLGAIPETLVESELFGHVKGAFTGAAAARKGVFQQADGGTLFLDDINTAPLPVQAKILRCVEDRRVTPVGSDKSVPVDFRLISASNCDIQSEISAGRFRQDLYYRLADLVVKLPPLRQRLDEIPSMAEAFLNDACEDLSRPPPFCTEEAMERLMSHPWPGNIRELKSVMRRCALFAGDALTPDLVIRILSSAYSAEPRLAVSPGLLTLEQAQRQAIEAALSASGNRRMKAAQTLGIDIQRLKRLLIKFGFVLS